MPMRCDPLIVVNKRDAEQGAMKVVALPDSA